MLEPQNVTWHIMVDDYMPALQFGKLWIKCIHGRPPPPGFFIGHWFYNLFIDHEEIQDDEYYILLTDDDFYEPGFFSKLQKYNSDIIICSMRRRHDLLPARPENIHIGGVGLEQLIIKGRLLKQYRINGFYVADGDLIMRLWQEQPDKFIFAPDAVCYFNFLPPYGNGNYNQWG